MRVTEGEPSAPRSIRARRPCSSRPGSPDSEVEPVRDVEGRPVATGTQEPERARPLPGEPPAPAGSGPRPPARPSGHKRVRPEVFRRRRRRVAVVALVILALLVSAVGWYESETGGSGG